jgi:two-component system cell cycle sensor histidine kinase/response regulator CckA
MDSGEAAPARPAPVVLVVDDEEDVRGLVCEILKHAGIAPLAARDGLEALAILEQLSGRISLVLTDVMMPEIEGPTLARRIAYQCPEIPVLFMTGYPPETLAVLGLLPADVPRIEKPFRLRELIERIRANLRPPGSGNPGETFQQ